MTEELLAATASSGESQQVTVSGADLPYVFHAAPPMPINKKASVQFLGGNGSWYPLYLGGFPQELTAVNNQVPIFNPGIYRLRKDATTEAVGLFGNAENKL